MAGDESCELAGYLTLAAFVLLPSGRPRLWAEKAQTRSSFVHAMHLSLAPEGPVRHFTSVEEQMSSSEVLYMLVCSR